MNETYEADRAKWNEEFEAWRQAVASPSDESVTLKAILAELKVIRSLLEGQMK